MSRIKEINLILSAWDRVLSSDREWIQARYFLAKTQDEIDKIYQEDRALLDQRAEERQKLEDELQIEKIKTLAELVKKVDKEWESTPFWKRWFN